MEAMSRDYGEKEVMHRCNVSTFYSLLVPWYYAKAFPGGKLQVEKEKFDDLLQRMLKQESAKTSAIKGKAGNLEPIIPPKKAPESSESR
jgi:hypothetical protein